MCNNKLIVLTNSSLSFVIGSGPDQELDNKVRKVFYFNLKS